MRAPAPFLIALLVVASCALTTSPVGASAPTNRVHATVNTNGAPYWRGWDIVRGVMLQHNGPGGYTVDGWGGIHAWGGARSFAPGVYLPGQIWVTGAALTDDDAGGLVIAPKAGGGVPWSWAFGSGANADLPGFVNLDGPQEPLSIGFADPVGGWASGVLVTGSGAIEAFVHGRPINTAGAPSWPGWEIVRGVAVKADGSGGFVLDGFGGIHSFGAAHLLASTGYWRGWDIARGIAIDGHGHGEVVDAWGGLHPFTYS